VIEYADNAGVKIAFERGGAGTGAPMLLVHGWSCDRTYLAPQFEHFARGHAVATVDLRGHGASDQPAPGPGVYTLDAFVGDLFAVSAACGFTRPVIVGHSIGALVALTAATSRMSTASAVVLIDPAPMDDSEEARALLDDIAASSAADTDGSFRTAIASGMFLPTDRVRRQEIIDGISRMRPDVAAAFIRAARGAGALVALGRCSVPVLSIGSAVPSNPPDALRSAKPDIVIGQTVGAGHFIQLEVLDQVNAMIERFLTNTVSVG
jgi:pimeloyl-ACP methyl ester carboxylesterase